MIAKINNFEVDLSKPIDISISLSNTDENPIAWYIEKPVIEPVVFGEWIGKISEGSSSTNFNNIYFNPHGHGTHTECLGHITSEIHSVNNKLKDSFFTTEVISVTPEKIWNEKEQLFDEVISLSQITTAIQSSHVEAIVLRTTPNQLSKKHKNYSSTNPPYLDVACVDLLNQKGVQHFLIDLPSVDRENDEGKLLFHHAFWQVPTNPQFHKTITEFIYIDDSIQDGLYLLNLQTAPFENDATPSRPVLFEILKK